MSDPLVPDSGYGVTHPWDQGLWIFPADHPLHQIEQLYRDQYLSPRFKDHLKADLKSTFGVAVKMQLEAGDEQ